MALAHLSAAAKSLFQETCQVRVGAKRSVGGAQPSREDDAALSETIVDLHRRVVLTEQRVDEFQTAMQRHQRLGEHMKQANSASLEKLQAVRKELEGETMALQARYLELSTASLQIQQLCHVVAFTEIADATSEEAAASPSLARAQHLIDYHADKNVELARAMAELAELDSTLQQTLNGSQYLMIQNRNIYEDLETRLSGTPSDEYTGPDADSLFQQQRAHRRQFDAVRNILRHLILASKLDWAQDARLRELMLSLDNDPAEGSDDDADESMF